MERLSINHYTRLQNAVNFIEENLDNPISLTDVSKSAFSSLSYFHRIFYFMTGFTVKEYIRKRRLSRAAYQLHCTGLFITDIALNAGYENLESFTRAFKKHFNISPRSFRQTNKEHPLFEKLDILEKYATQPSSFLDFDLTFEFVLYKEICIQGFQIHTTMEEGQQAIDICHFANKIMANKLLENYFNFSVTPIFGVYTNMTDENEFNYTIGCLENSRIKSSNKLVSHIIPTSQYAKFTLNRLDRIKEAWQYIYGCWFPNNDHYRTAGFDFEIYHHESVDIYIPMHTTP
jgi:AraC family transcriptional regulator